MLEQVVGPLTRSSVSLAPARGGLLLLRERIELRVGENVVGELLRLLVRRADGEDLLDLLERRAVQEFVVLRVLNRFCASAR